MVRLVAFLALLTLPAAASAAEYQIVIGGTPAVSFSGRCVIVDGERERRTRQLGGRIPSSGSLNAEAVDCRIQKGDQMGRLTVRLLQDGALIARASTRAAYGRVRVRSAGPWGAARGWVMY